MTFFRLRPLGFGLAAAIIAAMQSSAVSAAPGRFNGADPIDRMREADANHDGAVSRAELFTYRKSEWKRLDRNGDGYFSQNDLPGFVRDRWNGERLTELRTSFDANRDGRISQSEFLNGPTPAFDLADANNDGRVTDAEFKVAAAAVKAARQ